MRFCKEQFSTPQRQIWKFLVSILLWLSVFSRSTLTAPSTRKACCTFCAHLLFNHFTWRVLRAHSALVTTTALALWEGFWLWFLIVNTHGDLHPFRVQRAFCLTLQLLQDSHFHLENLLGLLGWFHLQGHILPGQQIHCLVNLPKATATNLLQLEENKEVWYSAQEKWHQIGSHRDRH